MPNVALDDHHANRDTGWLAPSKPTRKTSMR